ncbi:MAG: hypothetical protein WCC17_07060 [Candidatus Nitrosopolaris sp.]
MAGKSSKDISSRLKSLEERFQNDIKGLTELSVGNKTRTDLLRSVNTVEFILKGIVNESSLKTQTEYINYLISKLILCQKTVVLLVNILVNKHNRFEILWKKHDEKNNSNTKDDRYPFHKICELYGQIYGICQNIGTAIRDYFDLYQKIKSNISKREKDFKSLPVQDPEIQVSERIDEIKRETENCLLVNPSESILGLSAVRIGLESLIIIKIGDKMRQHIRMKSPSNDIDIRFTSKFKTEDVFHIIKELFPTQKEYEALDKIYAMSSKAIHRAISYPNYISWGCFSFATEELEKTIDRLNPDDAILENIILQLQNEEKICLI